CVALWPSKVSHINCSVQGGTKGQEENPSVRRGVNKHYRRSAGWQCVWFQKPARGVNGARERGIVDRDSVTNNGRLGWMGMRPFIDALQQHGLTDPIDQGPRSSTTSTPRGRVFSSSASSCNDMHLRRR